ncbi:PDDEXK nuclease domain-containing protein [Methylovulum psychrotolerans]|uniref:YhcG N-terminal domain-containing protein n=1 Tax=Methylovulum psychrotolerans TaxID=1704499 RepID=A0A1Z4C5U9_9GAMM|nr:PDDEXK nuclease domain-containing protein [Methylovulum psychrotolerans]ASF48868.1 hypothetical protein CEK71_21270 [Methylovulum psychrotolerans]
MTSAVVQNDFIDVVRLIEATRQKSYQAINTALIELYWQVGAYISGKISTSQWGDAVVTQLANHIAQTHPGLRGFTRRNLFRMRQFYETYRDDEKVSALLTQLSWTHNLIILSQSQYPEEREFYLRQSVQENWSTRELERQFKTALFERTVLTPPKVSAVVAQTHPTGATAFKDAYMLEFLGLPTGHSEAQLQQGLLQQLKAFLIELGSDLKWSNKAGHFQRHIIMSAEVKNEQNR